MYVGKHTIEREKTTQVGCFCGMKQLNDSVCLHMYMRVCQRALSPADARVLVSTRGSFSKRGEIFDYIVFTYPSDPNDLNIEHRSRRPLQSLHLQSFTV